MSQLSRQLQWIVWGALAAIIVVIVGAFLFVQWRPKPLPVYGDMISFSLTNQDGKNFTLANLQNQVWIADAIFTRCPGQCLIMTANLKKIQDALPHDAPIQLISFTTDPAFDTPAVLKKYATRFGAQPDEWTFLTGPKSELHTAELEGLKLSVMDKPAGQQASANDLFIHSEKFVLLDKEGRIRGWFDGEKPETPALLVAAAKRLAVEPPESDE